eukprot:856946-Heterocapsa_arctica.AAC.1
MALVPAAFALTLTFDSSKAEQQLNHVELGRCLLTMPVSRSIGRSQVCAQRPRACAEQVSAAPAPISEGE